MVTVSWIYLRDKETAGTQQGQNFPLIRNSLPIHAELISMSYDRRNPADMSKNRQSPSFEVWVHGAPPRGLAGQLNVWRGRYFTKWLACLADANAQRQVDPG